MVKKKQRSFSDSAVLESKMQNTKGTQSRSQPQKQDQSKDEPECHEGSADVAPPIDRTPISALTRLQSDWQPLDDR